LSVPSHEYYEWDYDKWYYDKGDGLATEFTLETVVTDDITVYSRWTGKTRRIIFKWWDGKTEGYTVKYPQTLAQGGVTLPVVGSRDNYSLEAGDENNWYNGGDLIELDTVLTQEEITVSPRWKFTGYNLTFNWNGATTDASPDNKTVFGTGNSEFDVKVGTLPTTIPKNTNYLFDGWWTSASGGGSEVTAATPVTGDATYYAKWVAVPSDWTYDSSTGGMSISVGHSKSPKEITILVSRGTYKFEVWGADGGITNESADNDKRAAGGYSAGSITNLTANTKLYLLVGEKGGIGAKPDGGTGGWNGGGNGGNAISSSYRGGGGGGGASDVRFISGTDDTESLRSRIIVAGGGGGKSISDGLGGVGGGVEGGAGKAMDSVSNDPAGGKQNGGHSFGKGALGGNGNGLSFSAEGHGGGGGGYFGGKARPTADGDNTVTGGGGGSGFVYGYTSGVESGANWIQPEYQDYTFTDGVCKKGSDSSIPAKSGNDGQIKITYTPGR
ncbi:MAG: InlB B-repeat-containing protein, partial [Treponema sp.]|nr:InlB B-repeat-containing protein [Treponema sp.]